MAWAVNSNTSRPIACSSLRRWASRCRSSAVQWKRWPTTSTTSRWSSQMASTRMVRDPPKVRCVVGRGRPARPTRRRNRRSRSECPTGPSSTDANSAAPWRPGPRNAAKRRAQERLRRPAVAQGTTDRRLQLTVRRRRRDQTDRCDRTAGVGHHRRQIVGRADRGVFAVNRVGRHRVCAGLAPPRSSG